MVKGVMASLGGSFEEPPEPAVPFGPHQIMPFPKITINLDSASGIGTLLHEVNRHVQPGMYPHTASEETRDPWGTPLALMDMPTTFDKRDNGMLFGRKVVSPMSMLCMRMKWGPFAGYEEGMSTVPIGNDLPFDHLSIHLGKEKAVLFIVSAGEPLTIEDNIDIFPSDALITQLRILTQREPTTQQG